MSLITKNRIKVELKKHRILLGICVVLTLIVVALPFYDRYKMVSITLEWGRLAPFPESAKDFSIETEGSMFTRSFRSHFKCTRTEFQKWADESPGLKNAHIEKNGSIEKHNIRPGGGAQGAWVKYDTTTGEVEVYVCWS